MIVLYKDKHVHACVCLLTFFQKTSPQILLTGFLSNLTGMFLRGSQLLFTVTEKSGLWVEKARKCIDMSLTAMI